MSDKDQKFYAAWAQLLQWMREYAAEREGVRFVKQADFTEYIYRMERPKALPTTIMSASLSSGDDPVLFVSVAQQHDTFREVTLNPFGSHVRRTLTSDASGEHLAEGKRIFTRDMLFELADRLFDTAAAV